MFRFGGWRVEDGILGKEGEGREIKITITIKITIRGR